MVGRRPNYLSSPSTAARTQPRGHSHRAAHAVAHHDRGSHRGRSGRTEVDLEKGAMMAPTKDAQRLRRAAERKGKAEDQFQLGCLY